MTGVIFDCVYLLLIVFASIELSGCDDCQACRNIVNAFVSGFERTATKGFSGGNTHWEMQNIGRYATSEIRFDDIMAGVCLQSDLRCHEMLDSLEIMMADWWNNIFKVDQRRISEFADYVCVSGAKHCCPNGHFGPSCDPCFECSTRSGSCDGNGTRSGSGKCLCNEGYVGGTCSMCNLETHFEVSLENNGDRVCQKCHASCAGGCRGSEPSDCSGCASGWSLVKKEEGSVCEDVDECLQNPCDNSTEYCFNIPGSYECNRCSHACDGCNGPLASDCIACREGYHAIDGRCEDIDECSLEPYPCQGDGEICKNTPGSYMCECQPQFEKRNGRCMAKQSGKFRKSSPSMDQKVPKSAKIIWTVAYTKEFVKYLATLLAFGVFVWFMQQNALLVLVASCALGTFVYHQSLILDTVYSKQL